jgi:hypothetical protein
MDDNSQAISFEELHSLYAAASALSEANAFRTVPTNYYKVQGVKHSAKRNDKGRVVINANADLYTNEKRVGQISVFLSPELGRTNSGKIDREFRLYAQLVRTLYPEVKGDAELGHVSVADVLGRFTQYPVGMFITETFASEPDGITGKKTYQDAKTADEAKALREKGWKAANYVQSIGKLKL